MNIKSQVLQWLLVLLSFVVPTSAWAGQVLTLDDCRTMALNNNKQMQVSRVKQSIAANMRRSARRYSPSSENQSN